MTYTASLIFATLLHNQASNVKIDSELSLIVSNSVNAPIIQILESRGLAVTLNGGQVLIEPIKIVNYFNNPKIIDSQVLEVVIQSPHTSSW